MLTIFVFTCEAGKLLPAMQDYTTLIQLIILCLFLLCASCADYETGYQHGYNNIDARGWLVFGKQRYDEGYEEGSMQAFHDDWYAENIDEIDVGLSCPAVVMRANPVVYTEQHGRIELK